jgi:predicted DNA-binding transcriptional regulator AlpA
MAKAFRISMTTRRKNPRQYLPDSAVYLQLGVSRATFYRLLEKGVISQPVTRIGKNRRGWTMADVGVAKQEIEELRERSKS